MKHAVSSLGFGVLGTGLLLALWQVAGASGVFGSGLPTALDAFAALFAQLVSPGFWGDFALTVGLTVLGLLGASVIGIPLGVLIGSFPVLKAASRAVMEFLKPIPPIVVLPLAVLLWGATAEMALILVAFSGAVQIAIQTVDGVEDTDPVALSTAKSYGMGTLETLFRVVLPSTLPYIGMAMRITAPTSLVVVIVAGLMGGAPGLGGTLRLAHSAGDTPLVYGLVVALGALGVAVHAATVLIERRVLRWHPAFRKVVTA